MKGIPVANRISNIIKKINQLQDELEEAFGERAEKFSYSLENSRVTFQREALKYQKQFKRTLWKYILNARFLTVLTAPVIYSLIFPFLILDIMASIYQAVCFPAYGIKKARRKDHIVFDRHRLAYLNLLEKLNCLYCSYCNGLLSYVSEIASRTEAFWCPIKHSRKMAHYHSWYSEFSDYGDGENYLEDLARNIANVRGENASIPQEADTEAK